MKKLFLHVGYPKTGTTGIQKFLEDNAEILARNGLLYPKAGRLNGAHYMLNFSLKIGSYDGPVAIPDAETLQNELRHEIDNSPCETVVVSSEYFITARDIEKVKAFFSGYDTRIVLYLRRHDYAFESGFAQGEKTAQNPPWEPDVTSFALYSICTGEVPYDYLHTLHRWRSVFGEGAIIVRPFEKQQNTPDLFSDFLAAINVEDSQDYTRPGTVNSSLSRETLLAARLLKKLNLPAPAKEKIISRLFATDGKTASERYFTPPIRSAVVAKYLPSYRVIAREFMGRADGILFREEQPRPNAPWPQPAAPELQGIFERILEALAPLIK